MKKTASALKPIIAAALLLFTLNSLAPAAYSMTARPKAATPNKLKAKKLPKDKNPFKIPRPPKKPPKYPKGPKVPEVKKLP